MAFTKVAPAGIGSTPGDGYRIGDSFLHSTGVEITNINATGILTAASLDISGSIDFDGHTELDNLNVAGVSTFNDDVNVVQGKKINFGNTNGTQGHIYFDGSTTRLQTNHGLNIGSPVCVFKSANLAETMVEAVHNAAVKLWFDSSTYSTPKFQTTATGVTIDGTAVAGALDISGDIDVDGHTNLDNVSIAGLTTASQGVRVPDGSASSNYISVGNSQDLKLYHDSSHSYIRDTGTGGLRITTDSFNVLNSDNNESMITATQDGSVNLYYNHNLRLTTESSRTLFRGASGIGVYGASGANDNGQITMHPTGSAVYTNLFFYNAAGNSYAAIIGHAGQTLFIDAGGTGYIRHRVSGSGNITFQDGNTERVIITSGGNMKIGSGTPAFGVGGGLEIDTGSAATIRLEDSGSTSSFEIQNSSSVITQNMYNNQPWTVAYSGGEKLRIDNTGALRINNTRTTATKLHVVGGTGSGTAYDAAVFAGGQNSTSGSGVKLYLSGCENDPISRGVILESIMTDNANAHRFSILVGSSSAAPTERLRITSSGDVQIGSQVNAGNTLRYLDVANYNTGASAGSIIRLLSTYSNGSGTVGLDIVKYKAGGAYIINNENIGADTGFIAFNTGSSGISPATHMRIAGNGEVIISPRNGGASNNRTSIHFNNATHSPFIAFKSNNLTEAAYIKVPESSGGANLEFQTKNTSGTLLSRLTLKNNGEFVTHQLAGGEKGYPLIMGTGTVSSNTNMSGSFNLHDVRGVHTGGGPNYHIGGWVYLGHDYGPAPYPARRFKIFAPSAFSNGTIVYQVWHNGDANYMHGGLWEIRMNLWTDGDIESVTIRCINGSRDDIRVYAYNDSNGIMIQTNSIWGQVFIRRAGWDDGGRNPGSSHCAVANNAALAIYNSQGTDDGAMPTSGSPVEVYAFDGTSGSAGATHTGAYSIENSSYFDG